MGSSNIICVVGLLVLLIVPACLAQDNQPDSTEINPARDSVLADDSTTTQDLPDSLSETERARLKFEQRMEQRREERAERPNPPFSFFDSLATYFTNERLNLRDDIRRSFYKNAGDYFKIDPSHVNLDHQPTPMRTTVQPYGLSGGRLDFLLYGRTFEPFEHIPEPDGLTDLNMLPTALDHDVFLLPGPVGKIFGGQQAIAALVTRSLQPDDFDAHSALIADQGGFGYDYVRGRYTKLFTDGRRVDASVGYRTADGVVFGRRDDEYHYYGDFYFPLSGSTGFRAWGHLYDRSGPLSVQSDIGGRNVARNVFDRAARLSLVRQNEARTRSTEIGYTHLRQGSYLSSAPFGRYNNTAHGGFIHSDHLLGSHMISLQADSRYFEYDNQVKNLDRVEGGFSVRLVDLSGGWRYALSAGTDVVEKFPLLPQVALALYKNSDNLFVLVSAAYSGRAPSLHEKNLPEHEALLYGGSGAYVEQGNPHVDIERQVTGSAVLEVGSAATNVRVSANGGKIFDGIDWFNERVSSDRIRFQPINGDITYATVTGQPRFQISDILTFLGGASYHHLDYEVFDSRAYAPEYEAFSGLELHVWWPQRQLDLFAYGELTYTGPYHGYFEEELGEELIASGKLSFQLKSYRMYFVFENVFANEYRVREYLTLPGRFFFFGFEWEFLD